MNTQLTQASPYRLAPGQVWRYQDGSKTVRLTDVRREGAQVVVSFIVIGGQGTGAHSTVTAATLQASAAIVG